MRFSKYLKNVLDLDVKLDVEVKNNFNIKYTHESIDPNLQDEFDSDPKLLAHVAKQEEFLKIYNKGHAIFSKKEVQALSVEDQRAYAIFAESMKDSEQYN